MEKIAAAIGEAEAFLDSAFSEVTFVSFLCYLFSVSKSRAVSHCRSICRNRWNNSQCKKRKMGMAPRMDVGLCKISDHLQPHVFVSLAADGCDEQFARGNWTRRTSVVAALHLSVLSCAREFIKGAYHEFRCSLR